MSPVMQFNDIREVRETLLFRESLLRMITAAGQSVVATTSSPEREAPSVQPEMSEVVAKCTPAVEQIQNWARDINRRG
jgi:hypothetical protein